MILDDYEYTWNIAELYNYSRMGTFLPMLEAHATPAQWKRFNYKKHQKRFTPKQKKIILEILGEPTIKTKPNHEPQS